MQSSGVWYGQSGAGRMVGVREGRGAMSGLLEAWVWGLLCTLSGR